MSDGGIPEAVRRLADARADARASRDFRTADRLKADIEAAGWRVVDRGFSYRLAPAHPPDIEVGGATLYGQVASVPSRLDEPPTREASVVVVADVQDPSPALATLEGLRRHLPPGTEAVVVVDAAAGHPDTFGALASQWAAASQGLPEATRLPLEIVGASATLGFAAALSIGLRRASGGIVVVVEAGSDIRGDIIGPITRALADRDVAVVGREGLVTRDLRRFESAPAPDAHAAGHDTEGLAIGVDAVTESVIAFRRSDAAVRGPLDERFRTRRGVAIWWSLVLRDAVGASPTRRAIWLADLPVMPAGPPATGRLTRGGAEGPEPGEAPAAAEGLAADERRLRKRDSYRIADRFGHRRELGSG